MKPARTDRMGNLLRYDNECDMLSRKARARHWRKWMRERWHKASVIVALEIV
jgi:hypothetical protein